MRYFSSPRSLPAPMYSVLDTSKEVGFPIRTFQDPCLLPTPRNFSEAATSFIASDRQGIHRVRLFACPYNLKLPLGYTRDLTSSQLNLDRPSRARLSLTTHFDITSSKTLATSHIFKEQI